MKEFRFNAAIDVTVRFPEYSDNGMIHGGTHHARGRAHELGEERCRALIRALRTRRKLRAAQQRHRAGAPLLLKHRLFVVDDTNDAVLVAAGLTARIPHGLYTRDEIQAFVVWEQAKAAQPQRQPPALKK